MYVSSVGEPMMTKLYNGIYVAPGTPFDNMD